MITKKLLDSFKFAFGGLWFCIKNERNFRVHIIAALTVCIVAPYYKFSITQMMLLTMVIALVIICEMFNTAIEAAIDLATSEYSELAKKAKDVSAGAVLISAFCAVICGLFLFLRFSIIQNLIHDILASPVKIGAVIVYIIIAYIFLRGFEKK